MMGNAVLDGIYQAAGMADQRFGRATGRGADPVFQVALALGAHENLH
jgi:hypothetical protein